MVKGTLASVADDVLSYAIHVLRDDRIVDDLGLVLHFLGQLLAEGDLFLQRVEVRTLGDIAIADLVRILLFVLLLLFLLALVVGLIR